jgi:hypothetical protein
MRIRDGKNLDTGWKNSDPGWKKFGSATLVADPDLGQWIQIWIQAGKKGHQRKKKKK